MLIELCRRLDMHHADLVSGLDAVLSNRREPIPDHDHDADCDTDALTVLTALTHARTTLRIDDLARALQWRLTRIEAALSHAQKHPHLGGPLSLQRIPPETFTVTPRLDVLTERQHRSVHTTAGYHSILTQDKAIVLLGALAYGHRPEYVSFRDTGSHRRAEARLKRAGILYSANGPHRVCVDDDVLYSLRYRDDSHIARERGEDIPGEPHSAAQAAGTH
ncbi:MAG: hypothetical protein ACRDR6_29905 [Pseudonocardiaceae bacterium]